MKSRQNVLIELVTRRGHHQRVIMVNWSPHADGKLVSVSYDCTVQVWDVSASDNEEGGGWTGRAVANFSGHGERLFCGIWSPVDPNVIMSGGEVGNELTSAISNTCILLELHISF